MTPNGVQFGLRCLRQDREVKIVCASTPQVLGADTEPFTRRTQTERHANLIGPYVLEVTSSILVKKTAIPAMKARRLGLVWQYKHMPG